MKRVFLGSTIAICLTIALSAVSNAQNSTPSLGDYARSVRQTKPQATKATTKVYDNDTIASTPSTINVVGSAPQVVADADKKAADDKTSDKATDKPASADSKSVAQKADQKADAIKPGQSLEERQKLFDAWKTRIADQKKKVDQLSHELNDYQHNSTLAQVSVWPETQKYGQGLAEKQKALDQAKTELSNLQEQARKAGVPSSVAE
ncbi:MAG: hypothetical protein ACRD3P_13820 [Terriglobales bacterium]